MSDPKLGIIGGSGLYQMEALSGAKEVRVKTPFGDPSDAIVLGQIAGQTVAFLPRHDRAHRIGPAQLPARANIYALKSLGVERVVSVTAVGSLREEISPGHMVVPDQIIDRTHGRAGTFFDEGLVVHVAFADPFCPELSASLGSAAAAAGAELHEGGTCVVIEGPAFSTRAESRLYRSWGAEIITMTMVPEARLAREAELCYAALATVTDYDCWHESEEPVTAKMVVRTLQQNATLAQGALAALVADLPSTPSCACGRALNDAIITPLDRVTPDVRARLSRLLGSRRP